MKTRKVLIISYLWPPMEGVGLIRALKFARYLPEYGWEPAILTVKCGAVTPGAGNIFFNGKVYRTEYKAALAGARSVIRRFILVPDEQIGWHKFAVAEGEKIIEKEGVDLIFSTSPPETAHLIARTLKRRCGIPWVADLRDLWSDDHYRSRGPFKRSVLRLMEKRVLRDADGIVTVSKPWAARLRNSSGNLSDRVNVIENGFDDEDFKGMEHGQHEKFTITYTGKLHRHNQPVDVFFRALKGMIEEGAIDRKTIEVRFHILGYERPDIAGMAAAHGLSDVVKGLGQVGYRESLRIQKNSDMLLFVQWKGEGNEGWYSAKIYDYIGSGRPILALANKGGIIDDIITRTSSGFITDNEYGIRQYIAKLYSEFSKNGFVRHDNNGAEVSKETRRLRAGSLAELFDSVSRKRRS